MAFLSSLSFRVGASILLWGGIVCAPSDVVAQAAGDLTVPNVFGPQKVSVDPGEDLLKKQREAEELQQNLAPPSVDWPETDDEDTPPEGAEKESEKQEGPCFPIDEIHIENASLLAPDVKNEILSRYIDSCMSGADINKLIHDLNNGFSAAGYITTRAYLPQQKLSYGSLRLLVIPGFIENIQINGKKADRSWRVLSAFPTGAGDILNLRKLEQGIDTLNRQKSIQAKMKLWPGEEPGGSRVNINITKGDSVQVAVTHDNRGSNVTGRHRLRLSMAVDNILGLNDIWGLHYIGALDTNALAASVQIPWEDWRLSAEASYSEYLTELGEVADLYGQSKFYKFTLARMLYRNARHKLEAEASLSLKASNRWVDEVNLTPQKMTVGRFKLSHTWRLDKSILVSDVAWAKGMNIFKATQDEDDPTNTPDDARPHAQFDKFEFGLTHYRSLPKNLQLRQSLRGQASFEPLYGSEQLTMGDVSTVRGYERSEAIGDAGFYLRNELAWSVKNGLRDPVLDLIARKLEPYFFIDGGIVHNIASQKTPYLTGMGVGVRVDAGWGKVDLSVARPLWAHPDIVKEDSVFSFSVTTDPYAPMRALLE